MVTTEDLVSVSGLCNEIIKRVGNGSLEPRDVTRALRELIDGRMPWHNRFAPYNGILLDLAEQKQRLVELDRTYWGGRFAKQIKALDTSGSYDQRVDAVRVFHVAGRTPQDTINNIWWPVIRGTWPNAYRWEELKTDPDHLDQAPNTRRYATGVHLVRLNLVAHWDPERPHTTEEVRARASENGELLAHGEVLSAYGLHTHLLGLLDGKNLPYADMAGYPGQRFARASLAVCAVPHEGPAHWPTTHRTSDHGPPVLRRINCVHTLSCSAARGTCARA